MTEPSLHVGRVKFYDPDKRFGFIVDFDGDEDAYVGDDGLLDPPLHAEEHVRFQLDPPRIRGKSPLARGIERLSDEDLRALASRYPQIAPPAKPRVGRVKFFDEAKGFGFVRDLLSSEELHVGAHAKTGPLPDNELVLFERVEVPHGRGARARDVRVLRTLPNSAALAQRLLPTDASAWTPSADAAVQVLVGLIDAAGWSALTDRLLAAWTPSPSRVQLDAAVAVDAHHARAVSAEAGARFRTAVAASTDAAGRAALWSHGWAEAFSVETAVEVYQAGGRVDALQRTPDASLGELAERLTTADPSTLGLRHVLDAALDAAAAGRALAPAGRRSRRIGLDTHASARVEIIVDAVLVAASDQARLDLFLAGYHDHADLGGALAATPVLSRLQVEGLLVLPNATSSDHRATLLAATTPGPEETLPERLTWLGSVATKTLGEAEARSMVHALFVGLPPAALVALWNSGVLKAPPPIPALIALAADVSWYAFVRATKAAPHDAATLASTRLAARVRAWTDKDAAILADGGEATGADDGSEIDLDTPGEHQSFGDVVTAHLDAQQADLDDVVRTLRLISEMEGFGAPLAFLQPLLPLPVEIHFAVWEEGVPVDAPLDALRERFAADAGSALADARRWIAGNRVDTAPVLDAIAASASALADVRSAADMAVLRDHLALLTSARRPAPPLTGRNADLVRLISWLGHGRAEGFDPHADRHLPVYLRPHEQVHLLRKLVALHERGELHLTADTLEGLVRYDADLDAGAQRHHGRYLDLSAEVFIQCLVGMMSDRPFLPDGVLLDIAYRGLASHPDRPLSLANLDVFDACPGRLEPDFDDRDRRGTIFRTAEAFVLAFDYDPHLVAAVKTIPGRAYDAAHKRWTVPVANEPAVRAFATANRFGFKISPNYKTDNKHFYSFRRGAIPAGVTYCDGREAPQPDAFHGRPFWWCTNSRCFRNATTPHDPDAWESYTLLDAARALGCSLDEHKPGGTTVPNGRYYAFVGTVNRVNRLLPHLKCRACSEALYPEKSSNYAHYRVTQFWCQNAHCSGFEQTVYLHHCLRGACSSVIDSRDSHTCSNGWYVCTNPECGACCSNSVFSRRAANRDAIGLGPDLRRPPRGHLEHGEAFCYRCGVNGTGTAMVAHDPPHPHGDGGFTCPRCGMEYQRGRRAPGWPQA